MMGSGARSEHGDLYALLDLVKDDDKYKVKVAELDQKIKEANHIFSQATAQSRRAEETRQLATDMLEQANTKNIEASTLKREQERLAAETALREQRLVEQRAKHEAHVYDYATTKLQAESALAGREKQLDTREKAIVAAEQALAQAHLIAAAEQAELKKKAEAEAAKAMQLANKALAEAQRAKNEAEKITADLTKKRQAFEEFVSKNL